MLVDAELNIDLKASFMAGDRWRDIDCGSAAGCTTVLIGHGYREVLRTQAVFRSCDLSDAGRQITGDSAAIPR